MIQERKFLIDGEWRTSNRKREVLNPFNGQVVSVVWQAGPRDSSDAVAAASKAFHITRTLPSHERAEILMRIRDGILERKDELARAITMEAGKPLKIARLEVARAALTFGLAAEEAKRIGGEVLPLDLAAGSENRIGITKRFPIGPILGITPFNFPLNLVAHKVAPSIAAGNTIVLKPASQTPTPALILGEIALQAGLLPGAFNVITCAGSMIDQVVADDRIKMVSFTGSAEVGWSLKNKVAEKKVTLELGGNAGVIIHSDVSLNYAVERCVYGAFVYSGQVCISVQRIYVHSRIYEQFLKRFLKLTSDLMIGDPMDEKTDIGPLIDSASIQKVDTWLREAIRNGAKVLTGGRKVGHFLEPTVLTDVDRTCKISRLEVFAPVVIVAPYEDFSDAVTAVNDSIYGLQAGVFTNNFKLALDAFQKLDVGGVILNDVPTYRIDHMPYGGVKASGVGREGVKYAIEEMTELKFLAMNFADI